ncbi:hypothetical protein [Melissospora conviva]|uniref:hypothetical protein n=1 Tax=Melissospora conviva TaxID=3388432 RepID=UPI003C23280B
MTTSKREQQVLQARGALIMAARRRSLVTYKELGLAIDTGALQSLGPVLDDLSDLCFTKKEPSLACLVVSTTTGAPGEGYDDGGESWHTSVQKAFRYWAER